MDTRAYEALLYQIACAVDAEAEPASEKAPEKPGFSERGKNVTTRQSIPDKR